MNFIKTVLNRPVSALLIIFSIIVFGVVLFIILIIINMIIKKYSNKLFKKIN